MSTKINPSSVLVVSVLGAIWYLISTAPANAVFEARGLLSNQYTLTDISGRQFVYQPGGCNSYKDTTANNVWLIWSPIYYFRSNIDNTTVPLAFGTLRNQSTGEIWDGGVGTISARSIVGNLVFTVPMSCTPSRMAR